MNINNEPIFSRARHDKKNPYVMISREIFQDPTISLKAKGLLGFFLSLPDNWQIYHSNICQQLNVGKDALNSAIDELINAGYVKRTREKVKGVFQPYHYLIAEFKLFLPERVFRSGKTAAENPPLSSNDTPSTEIPSKKEKVLSSSSSRDDACGADDDPVIDFSKEVGSIATTNSKGETVKTSIDSIFKHFIKKDFTTDIVREAIEAVKDVDTPINNVMGYLESCCVSIVNGKSRKSNKKRGLTPDEICAKIVQPPESQEPLVSFTDRLATLKKEGKIK